MRQPGNNPRPGDPEPRATAPSSPQDGDGPDLDAMMEQIREDVQRRRVPTGQDAKGDPQQRSDFPSPALTPAEIMERVRAEVARRRARSAVAGVVAEDQARLPADSRRLPRWRPAEPRLDSKPEYKLAELLRYDDADFVETAYQTLLHRAPKPAGRDYYLKMLREGHISKVEILGLIRFSEEGRRCGVHVDGLLLPYKLHQWRHKRVVGAVLGFAMGVFRLPRLALRLQSMEANAARESQELGRLLNRVDEDIQALRTELAQSVLARVGALRALGVQIETVEGVAESQAEALRHQHQEADRRHREVADRLGALDQAASGFADELRVGKEERDRQHREVTDRQAALDQTLSDRDRAWRDGHAMHDQRLQEDANRLTSHEAAIARLNDQASSDQRTLHQMFDRVTEFIGAATRQAQDANPNICIPSALASQYASFEDDFRGEREQIKLRATHYLGTLKNAGIEPGSGLILDLGSGRGEWLEVLTEHGYACRGVDLNAGMLAESRARGHAVVEADAIDHLQLLEDGSVAAITSMHLVEHLPHPVLINLLDEALRVLMPGGLLVLETPNPENVLVGSCMFYMDPTHLHPIPPPLLQWLVKSRGFDDPVIERLSEHRGKPDLTPVSDKVPGAGQINQMIEWFTAPPDYAVVASKR